MFVCCFLVMYFHFRWNDACVVLSKFRFHLVCFGAGHVHVTKKKIRNCDGNPRMGGIREILNAHLTFTLKLHFFSISIFQMQLHEEITVQLQYACSRSFL